MKERKALTVLALIEFAFGVILIWLAIDAWDHGLTLWAIFVTIYVVGLWVVVGGYILYEWRQH